jgi:hypothetical protein
VWQPAQRSAKSCAPASSVSESTSIPWLPQAPRARVAATATGMMEKHRTAAASYFFGEDVLTL